MCNVKVLHFDYCMKCTVTLLPALSCGILDRIWGQFEYRKLLYVKVVF